MGIGIDIDTNVCVYVYIHKCISHIQTYAYVYIYIHIQIAHTYIYICVYIHISNPVSESQYEVDNQPRPPLTAPVKAPAVPIPSCRAYPILWGRTLEPGSWAS